MIDVIDVNSLVDEPGSRRPRWRWVPRRSHEDPSPVRRAEEARTSRLQTPRELPPPRLASCVPASSMPRGPPPFSAPLTFPRPATSYVVYVVRRQPSIRRSRQPRRSHVNDVNPQQPRHVHKPPAHKAPKESSVLGGTRGRMRFSVPFRVSASSWGTAPAPRRLAGCCLDGQQRRASACPRPGHARLIKCLAVSLRGCFASSSRTAGRPAPPSRSVDSRIARAASTTRRLAPGGDSRRQWNRRLFRSPTYGVGSTSMAARSSKPKASTPRSYDRAPSDSSSSTTPWSLPQARNPRRRSSARAGRLSHSVVAIRSS